LHWFVLCVDEAGRIVKYSTLLPYHCKRSVAIANYTAQMGNNFAKIHKTIRVTPSMEAGLAKDVMSIEEIVRLAD